MANRKHGARGTPTWSSWRSMLARCEQKGHDQYPRYGGRGITVCREWHDFEAFRLAMGERPSSAHTIDRIDNSGNYEPGNCRWATKTEQSRNRRNSRYVEIDGQRKLLVEWLETTGVSRSLYEARKRLGWTDRDAILTKAESRKPYGSWKQRGTAKAEDGEVVAARAVGKAG